jgi:hypothetical protein
MQQSIFHLDLIERIQSANTELEEPEDVRIETTGLYCSTCNQETDREHFKTDWHRYNLKRKMKNMLPISEVDFEEMQEISSIESEGEEEFTTTKSGTPFVHFELDKEEELLIYKQVLSSEKNADWKQELLNLQQRQTWTLLLLASGHFAGAVIDCATATPIVHKAFHRYTTRRKQGGAQSSNDKSKGKANSAGAGIRRYNEQALREEIQELITNLKGHIKDSSRIFIRAPVTMKKTLFFDKQVLDNSDSRIRSLPFITKRPTLQELMRCFQELTAVRVVPKMERAATPRKNSSNITKEKVQTHLNFIADQKEDIIPDSLQQLFDQIKKGKVDLFKSSVDIEMINTVFGSNHGTSLLHVASSSSQCEIIDFLLESGADPTLHAQNKTVKPYDVAGNKDARDVFRRFMYRYPEKWDYQTANIPGPLTPEMEEKQAEKEKQRKKKEKERKKEKQKEQKEKFAILEAAAAESTNAADQIIKKTTIMKLSDSERQTLGMTPEQRQRFDREKRAMAAEARMRSSQNKCGNCGKSLLGITSFDKSIYRYCSMACLKVD